ncbi:MAG: hypothetical protein ACP5GR_06435, partial [Thermoplasmata archaeon]
MQDSKANVKIVFIKWFPGEPKTGGEKVFYYFYNILKKWYDVQIVECLKNNTNRDRHIYLYYLISKPFEIVCRNRLSIKLVKMGYEVYSDSL